MFLVPADTPGVTVGPKDHKMGQEGATTADVTFDDVRVTPTRSSAARCAPASAPP